MRRFQTILLLLVLGASRTTTRPAMQATSPPPEVAAAEAVLKEARVDAEKTVRATPEYTAAKARADEAMEVLEQARASGTSEEKLAASSAYVRAAAAARKIELDAVAKDDGVLELKRMMEDAKIHAAAEARAAAERDARDPIKRAIREGQVVIGMTEAQMWLVMGQYKTEHAVVEDRNAKYFIWRIGTYAALGGGGSGAAAGYPGFLPVPNGPMVFTERQRVEVDIRGGIVTHVEKSSQSGPN